MATPTINDSTCGTDSRDFADVALWDAGVPDPSDGDGTVQICTCFDDSVFTEVGTIIRPSSNLFTFFIVRANEAQAYNGLKGAGVVFKPTSGTTYILWFRNHEWSQLYGIEFDGSDPGYTGDSLGLVITGQGGNNQFIRCCFHDGPSHGLAGIGSPSELNAVYCIFHDNVEDGMHGTSLAWAFACGFIRNGGAGLKGSSVNLTGAWMCWSLVDGSGGASFETMTVAFTESGGFNVVDDTFHADNSGIQPGWQESVDIDDCKFTDPSASDFRLTEAGILQGAGWLRGPSVTGGAVNDQLGAVSTSRDLAGSLIALDLDEVWDVGPEQFSHTPADPTTIIRHPLALALKQVSKITLKTKVTP